MEPLKKPTKEAIEAMLSSFRRPKAGEIETEEFRAFMKVLRESPMLKTTVQGFAAVIFTHSGAMPEASDIEYDDPFEMIEERLKNATPAFVNACTRVFGFFFQMGWETRAAADDLEALERMAK